MALVVDDVLRPIGLSDKMQEGIQVAEPAEICTVPLFAENLAFIIAGSVSPQLRPTVANLLMQHGADLALLGRRELLSTIALTVAHLESTTLPDLSEMAAGGVQG